MSYVKILGIDIAKNVFHLHGTDSKGNKILQKKVGREKFLETLICIDAEVIVMEACGGANYWARTLKKQNRQVKLISPQFVKPFVKRNKNDWNDAEAICEAASRPSMVFVEPLTEERQDIQSIHRIRQGLIETKTACGNRIRGLLAEYGKAIPLGAEKLMKALPVLLNEGNNGLSEIIKSFICKEMEQLQMLKKQIAECDQALEVICQNNELCQKLRKIPGIGIINASILYVKLGMGVAFKNGRHFAAYLGLTPRQHSSGGKNVLLGISKRGDGYVRRNLIHGARSLMLVAGKKAGTLSKWIIDLSCRKKANVVAVALANKLARIAWTIVKNNLDFKLA